MLDCSRMTHRVHTILSILAEDHAPAALRPSILLAIDWPTVAEEAPATGDDAGAATLVALRLRGAITDNHSAIAPLAARLATVAASLTATGDKVMSTHAAALWGAAAALVGQPTIRKNGAAIEEVRNTLGEEVKDHEHLTVMHMARAAVDTIGSLRASVAALATKAADIVPGVIAAGPAEKATLIATALDRIHEYRNNGTAEAFDRGVKIRAALGIMPGEDILGALAILRETLFASSGIGIMSAASMQAENLNLARQGRDRALGDIHALRDILKVPAGGNLVNHASAFAERHSRMHAENTRLRAQVDRMIAAMREDAPASAKPRPQPGDAVPWAEVEDGCLYYNKNTACPFVTVVDRHHQVMNDASDPDIARFLKAPRDFCSAGKPPTHAYGDGATLVARDLGADPEAWRKAMREWTANGNKPADHAKPPGQWTVPGPGMI